MRRGIVYYGLLLSVMTLIVIGLVMVQEAGSVFALKEKGDSFLYLKEQLLWIAAGTLAGVGTYLFGHKRLKPYSGFIFLVGIVACILVFVPGLGLKIHGATRWLRLGGINLQPSELAKIGAILFAAERFSSRKKLKRETNMQYAMPVLIGVCVLAGIVMMQDDLGTTMIICASALAVMFAAGFPIGFLGALVGGAVLLVAMLIFVEPYRRSRFLAFLDPMHDPTGKSYQLIQGLIAIGTGGLVGVGFGASRQKALYLPNPHTDYIFAIIAEEKGFLGSLVVIALFAIIAVCGFIIAKRCRDKFGRLLAAGITGMICFQAVINIAGVSTLLPLTGVPLPFISKGGTSLIVLMACVGLLLDIGRGPSVRLVERRGNAGPDNHGRDGRAHKSGPRPGSRAVRRA